MRNWNGSEHQVPHANKNRVRLAVGNCFAAWKPKPVDCQSKQIMASYKKVNKVTQLLPFSGWEELPLGEIALNKNIFSQHVLRGCILTALEIDFAYLLH